LATRLGVTTQYVDDIDKARAEAALADATTLVLAEVTPAIAERWTANAPRAIELVILTAARRGYENPRGIYQETLGEHTVGLTEATGVYLTVLELAQVRRAAYGRDGGFVGTVRTPSAYERAPHSVHDSVTST